MNTPARPPAFAGSSESQSMEKISNFELIWRVSPTIPRQSNKISCKSDHFLSLPSSSLHDSLCFLDKNNHTYKPTSIHDIISTMKRSAPLAPNSRTTRAVSRKLEVAVLEERREQERQEVAASLMSSSLLQALPFILSQGFLYKGECRNAALASKKWHSIFVESQNQIPPHCQVQVELIRNPYWPEWVLAQGLQEVLPTQDFARSIFEQMCELKVKSQQTKSRMAKMRASLPQWGVNFFAVQIRVWEANSHNRGGIFIRFLKFSGSVRWQLPTIADYNPSIADETIRGWSIRLDVDLILWTWGTFRKWRNIYNDEPLWDWNFDWNWINANRNTDWFLRNSHWLLNSGMLIDEGTDDEEEQNEQRRTRQLVQRQVDHYFPRLA